MRLIPSGAPRAATFGLRHSLGIWGLPYGCLARGWSKVPQLGTMRLARCAAGKAPFYAIISTSALGAHAHKGRHRLIGDGHPVVLGVPLGTGSAHVIELGPVRIEQASRQIVRELGEIGEYARRRAVRGPASSRLFHDRFRSTLRLTGSPFRSVLSPWSASCRLLSRRIC